VPSARVWRQATYKANNNNKTPWARQGLMRHGLWVGLPQENPDWPNRSPKRTACGGWASLQEYREAYLAHAPEGGKHPLVGSYWSAESAVSELQRAIAMPLPSAMGLTPDPPCPVAEQLIGSKKVAPENQFAWGPASASWVPRGGCMSNGKWKDSKESKLGAPHAVNLDSEVQLLPLMAKLTEEDGAIIDQLVHDPIASGMAVKWDEDMGLPTVVSSLRVVFQTDSKGKAKPRVITDFRYANGAIWPVPLVLPTVSDFVRTMKEGELMSKQDMKSGFMQMGLREEDRHLATFLWKGCLIQMTVECFGWRDAPGAFQLHTSKACEDALRATQRGVKVARVYIDDFFQRWHLGLTPSTIQQIHGEWIENIVENGIVLGVSKCLKPSTECEILGIDASSVPPMRLTVPPLKCIRYRSSVQDLLEKVKEHGKAQTREVAVVLGRLASVEVAVPHIILLSRPLIDDLKIGLADAHAELRKLEELPSMRNEAEAEANYAWIDTMIPVSADTVKSLEYLVEHWDEMNGQLTRRPAASLVIFTDASETGIGGRVFRVGSSGELDLVGLFAGDFSQEELDYSSTAREALAQLKAVQWLAANHPILLAKARIESVSDNMGLVRRYAMGSTVTEVSSSLLQIVIQLRAVGATWVGARWLPRALLDREDALSRLTTVKSDSLRVNKEWFTNEFIPTLRAEGKRVPKVDAFSNGEDNVLDDFATDRPIPGRRFDGLQQDWKARDVPWMFPPTSLIAKAVQRWRDSASLVAYICVPAVRFSHPWLRGLAELRPVRRAEVVPIDGLPDGSSWEYTIYALIKPSALQKAEVKPQEVEVIRGEGEVVK
jgi:hypothetical protein